MGPLQVDHRTPLARGGANMIDNILPACSRCNLKKRLMTEAEFRARLASERGDNLQSTS
jgi:5-methylcytosine-specific restriction endonuclease McrA